MSFESAANTIRSRFYDDFPTYRPNVDIAWPNANYTPTSGEEWVRLNILPASSRQVATVGDKWRHPGVVSVQIFVPEGTGDGKAYAIADDVAAVFQGMTLSGVRFKATSANTVGPDADGWYQVQADTDFEYDT